MKKIIYVVTHGDSGSGHNPIMTDAGLEQIHALRDLVKKIAAPDPYVVVGTGRRHYQTYATISSSLEGNPVVIFSPFAGSGDALEKDGQIALENYAVPSDKYLGLVNNPGFDAWDFVGNLPNGTLICGGGELMTSLGLSKSELIASAGLSGVNKTGQLYELDVAKKTGRLVS